MQHGTEDRCLSQGTEGGGGVPNMATEGSCGGESLHLCPNHKHTCHVYMLNFMNLMYSGG